MYKLNRSSNEIKDQVHRFIHDWILAKRVVMFSKSQSPECRRIERMLRRLSDLSDDVFCEVDMDRRQDVTQIENFFWFHITGKDRREVPVIFVDGKYVGGYTEIVHLALHGRLSEFFHELLKPRPKPRPCLEVKIHQDDQVNIDAKINPDLGLPVPDCCACSTVSSIRWRRSIRRTTNSVIDNKTVKKEDIISGDGKMMYGLIRELPKPSKVVVTKYTPHITIHDYATKGLKGLRLNHIRNQSNQSSNIYLAGEGSDDVIDETSAQSLSDSCDVMPQFSDL